MGLWTPQSRRVGPMAGPDPYNVRRDSAFDFTTKRSQSWTSPAVSLGFDISLTLGIGLRTKIRAFVQLLPPSQLVFMATSVRLFKPVRILKNLLSRVCISTAKGLAIQAR